MTKLRKAPSTERLIATLLRVQGALETLSVRTGNFISGLSLGLLDDAALGRLTVSAYDRRGEYGADAIFDWEVEWFERDLPALPARILVGAAGSGREVRFLEERGYSVIGFEPARSFVDNANRIGHLKCEILHGSYEDVTNSTSPLMKRLGSMPQFDAVVLGWGSLMHVPGLALRSEVLTGLRGLCPHGPLLASFWLADGLPGPPRSKARLAGRKVAQLFGGSGEQSAADGVSGRFGYHHKFTEEEIERLAEESGCRLKESVSTLAAIYPHVTFWPSP